MTGARTTTKEAFLGRLRTAMAAGAPPSHRPLVEVDRPPEVTPRWPDPDASLVERWVSAFEAVGGRVHHATQGEVAAAVAIALAGRGPVLVDGRHPVRDGTWLAWPGCGLEAAASAVCGVIDATAAIAATGSLVVDTTRSGRLVSLLPRVAVFVVPASAVVATTGDVLRRHSDLWPDGPPTNVVLVTGPSRSVDIEMRLVVGVHGPGEVHAVLVDDR